MTQLVNKNRNKCNKARSLIGTKLKGANAQKYGYTRILAVDDVTEASTDSPEALVLYVRADKDPILEDLVVVDILGDR